MLERDFDIFSMLNNIIQKLSLAKKISPAWIWRKQHSPVFLIQVLRQWGPSLYASRELLRNSGIAMNTGWHFWSRTNNAKRGLIPAWRRATWTGNNVGHCKKVVTLEKLWQLHVYPRGHERLCQPRAELIQVTSTAKKFDFGRLTDSIRCPYFVANTPKIIAGLRTTSSSWQEVINGSVCPQFASHQASTRPLKRCPSVIRWHLAVVLWLAVWGAVTPCAACVMRQAGASTGRQEPYSSHPVCSLVACSTIWLQEPKSPPSMRASEALTYW